MSNGHIKKNRCQKAKDLKRNHTAAFLVLDTIAENAKRKKDNSILELGEAIITAEECGITKHQLPHALEYLQINGFIEVIHRGRKDKDSKLLCRTGIKPESTRDKTGIKTGINGTVVKLLDSECYDINIEDDRNQNRNQTGINPRQNPAQTRNKEIRNKEDHHPQTPSSKISPIDEEDDDDFFSKEKRNEQGNEQGNKQISNLLSNFMSELPKNENSQIIDIQPFTKAEPEIIQHNIENQTQVADTHTYNNYNDKMSNKIQVISGVFLTQPQLDECIKFWGSRVIVEDVVLEIQSWPGREFQIKNWFKAITTWKRNKKTKHKLQITDNEAYAKKLCDWYTTYEKGGGWKCYFYKEELKDQRGVLFEYQSPYVDGFFVAYSDPDFINKCFNFLVEKGMVKKKVEV